MDSQVANAKVRRRFETLLAVGPEVLDVLLILCTCVCVCVTINSFKLSSVLLYLIKMSR